MPPPALVNNTFYNELGQAWWSATDHMVTFLRHESAIRVAYCCQHLPPPSPQHWIAEFGAGAGFVTLALAEVGYRIVAVDLAPQALDELVRQAEQRGLRDRVHPVVGDITQPLVLPHSVQAVLAMDVLEHVPNPQAIVAQAAAHLPEGGHFVYHTLNRTLKCWLLYLQLAPRLIRHSPPDVHRLAFNIRPAELHQWLQDNQLQLHHETGTYAPLFQRATWELLTKRAVHYPMRFAYTADRSCGYLGVAVKKGTSQ